MIRQQPPKIEMDDNIVSALTKAPEILDGQRPRDKDLEKNTLKQIKFDFYFGEIIDSSDQGKVPD